jgi:hypothetical protein
MDETGGYLVLGMDILGDFPEIKRLSELPGAYIALARRIMD